MCHHSANKSLFYWRLDKKMNLSQLIRGKWGHPNYGNLYSLYMHTCTSHIPVQWMKRQSLVVICRKHNIKLERDQKLPVRLPIINLYLFFLGTCKMRNETKRNKSKRNSSKRNEIYRNETKRGKFRFFSVNFVSIYFAFYRYTHKDAVFQWCLLDSKSNWHNFHIFSSFLLYFQSK